MDNITYFVFFAAFAGTMLWLLMIRKLVIHLARNHPDTYEALGSPRLWEAGYHFERSIGQHKAMPALVMFVLRSDYATGRGDGGMGRATCARMTSLSWKRIGQGSGRCRSTRRRCGGWWWSSFRPCVQLSRSVTSVRWYRAAFRPAARLIRPPWKECHNG